MHFLRLITLAAPALAFTIPAGQPEGVYEVSFVNGEEVHQLLKEPSIEAIQSRRSEESAKLMKRGPVCGGDALNHGDTDSANNELDQQCGGGARVSPGRSYYSIVGCTVAYFCNFGGNTAICRAGDRQAASRDITNTCGLYNSGWEPGMQSYGYENFCKSPGNNFCGHGRN